MSLPNFNQVDLASLDKLLKMIIAFVSPLILKCARFMGGLVDLNIKRPVCLGLVHLCKSRDLETGEWFPMECCCC